MKQLGVIISQSRIIIKYRVIIDYALIAIMNFWQMGTFPISRRDAYRRWSAPPPIGANAFRRQRLKAPIEIKNHYS